MGNPFNEQAAEESLVRTTVEAWWPAALFDGPIPAAIDAAWHTGATDTVAVAVGVVRGEAVGVARGEIEGVGLGWVLWWWGAVVAQPDNAIASPTPSSSSVWVPTRGLTMVRLSP
ncbi:MAG TPA: hypothetical protein VMV12_05490 [Candidatus Micrarchaeaceae archaeon]|nr:hypothetical protein [Candidatus Micrarchaeaceae archaeon]